MKIFLTFLTLFLLVLAGCTNENEPAYSPNISRSHNQNATHISPEEATVTAISLIENINGANTRSSSLKVRSIDIISSEAALTRSGNSDSLLYVINFEGNQGFAIMGSDKRMQTVYALSDEGNFEMPSSTDCALNDILEGIKMDAEFSISGNFTPDTTISIGPIHPIQPSLKRGPYIRGHMAQISPSKELSGYCFDQNGNQGRTGCAAIAISQIMSYHSWPENMGDREIAWKSIKKGEDDDCLSYVLGQLGLPNNLDMIYTGPEGIGGAYPSRYRQTFLNYGYNADDWINLFYDDAKVRQTLGNGPILMYAQSSEYLGTAHVWTIDGFIAYFTNSYLDDDLRVLYHCVWGLDGHCNGYYYVADTRRFWGTPDEFDSIDSKDISEEYYVRHDFDIRYIGNIDPKN